LEWYRLEGNLTIPGGKMGPLRIEPVRSAGKLDPISILPQVKYGSVRI
jgi:hypothetical protein